MFRTDIAFAMGGSITGVKYTIPESDLTAAATTQTITLLENPTVTTTAQASVIIPQGGVILYSRIKQSAAFTGGGLTAMTVSIGKLGGSNTFVQPAFNVFQAPADGTLQEAGLIFNGQLSSWSPTVTFTSTSANVVAATAGSVDIYLYFLNVSTAATASGTPSANDGGTGV